MNNDGSDSEALCAGKCKSPAHWSISDTCSDERAAAQGILTAQQCEDEAGINVTAPVT